MAVRRQNNKSFKADLNRRTKYALLVTGELFATKVREKTPVRTARLRSSIQSEGKVKKGTVNGKKVWFVTISTPVDYAAFVEFGTIKQAPAAMFRRTIKEDKDLLSDTFNKLIS